MVYELFKWLSVINWELIAIWWLKIGEKWYRVQKLQTELLQKLIHHPKFSTGYKMQYEVFKIKKMTPPPGTRSVSDGLTPPCTKQHLQHLQHLPFWIIVLTTASVIRRENRECQSERDVLSRHIVSVIDFLWYTGLSHWADRNSVWFVPKHEPDWWKCSSFHSVCPTICYRSVHIQHLPHQNRWTPAALVYHVQH